MTLGPQTFISTFSPQNHPGHQAEYAPSSAKRAKFGASLASELFAIAKPLKDPWKESDSERASSEDDDDDDDDDDRYGSSDDDDDSDNDDDDADYDSDSDY